MGDLMFNAGIAMVLKTESVWHPVMGTTAEGNRGIVGARPDKKMAGVPDFFAVLGPTGGGRGLFFEAKECAGRKINLGDDNILRPKQRAWMDYYNGRSGETQAMHVPCFVIIRFVDGDKIFRLPWIVASQIDKLDASDPVFRQFMVGPYYLEDLILP
jgi:hypothetical protein